eukprot:12416818-Karenia_brevis.AAC.1
MPGGHRFLGSGGAFKCNKSCGKHGVGILLHARWAKKVTNVARISPRLMYVDMEIGSIRVRLMSVYMPHAGHPDHE